MVWLFSGLDEALALFSSWLEASLSLQASVSSALSSKAGLLLSNLGTYTLVTSVWS